MKVLLADQDPGARQEIESALAESGHEVLTAADGETAWNLLSEPNAPKLVILEWTLPKGDALQLIRKVQAMFAPEPAYFILLNARHTPEDFERAFGSGAHDYLPKPFNRRELLARIQFAARAVQRQTESAARLAELDSQLGRQKQAEQARAAEQSYLQPLMDNLPMTIYFKDRESRFTLINRAQATRLGLTDPSQALGKTDRDFFGPEHATQAFQDEQHIIRTGEPIIESEEKETWPDGRVTWVTTTKSPLVGPNGEIVGTFGVSRDVTVRRQAETERRFLASLAEASDDAIIGVSPDGTVASWNHGAKHLYGYKAEEMVGRSYSLLIPPDRLEESERIRSELNQGNRILHYETENVAKDDRRIAVSLTVSPIKDTSGAVTGAVVVARDITARKQTEDELYRSRQMLQTVLDTIPQRVFWKDRNLRYFGCNKAFAADAGLSNPAEIVGKSDFDLTWSESADVYRADDSQVMASELPKLDFDEEQRRTDGSLVWLRTNKVPLRDRNGEVAGVLGTYEDITERKLAEEAFRASEARFRRLFERNLAGVFRMTIDGRIVECNESAARILGYNSVGEVLTLRAQDIDDSDVQRDAFARKIETEGQVSNYELRWRHRNGHAVWVIANVSLLPGGNGNGAFIEGTLVDITDRKRAEAALEEEAALAALRADVGVALTRGGGIRSALQECAEALVKWTGVAFARIWTLDASAASLLMEASAGMYTHIDGPHGVLPTGQFKIGLIAQNQQPHLTNDVQNDPEISDREWAKREGLVSFVGHPLIVEDQVVGVAAAFARKPLTAAAVLAFSSVADQIARFVMGKRAQEALQRSEEHARLLFACIPHPAYVFDMETLSFLEVNDLAVERYGYSREEFLAMRTTELFASESGERCEVPADRALTYNHNSGESKHRTREGKVIDVEMSVHTLDYHGRRAALVVAQDITKRKELELDLRHAQKLEAVGGLAAGIAHEINTPIQFVGDNLRFLQDSFGTLTDLLEQYRVMGKVAGSNGTEDGNLTEDEEEIEYLAEEIPKALSQSLDGVERVAAIVKAMKEFAHPEQKQKVAANLNRALASTLVVARNELKYVADVETDFGDIPAVECYPGDLNQVFLNLLINAAHAIQDAVDGTGNRGTIRVQTRRQEESVTVSISDTGCGIPESIHDKLFDPFFTTKEVGRGTGQGLAISRSIIVEKHGGKLTFESQLGRGTTFTIQLPMASAAA